MIANRRVVAGAERQMQRIGLPREMLDVRMTARKGNTYEPKSIAVVWAAGYFDEYGDAACRWLRNYGWEATKLRSLDGVDAFDGVIVIGISFFRYIPWSTRTFWVGIQSEQMPLEGDMDWSLERNLKRYRGLSRYYDLIMEWSPANFTRNPRPDRVRYLPYGCEAETASPAEKRFDILFLGNPSGSNNRRGKLLEKLKQRYQVCERHFAWGAEKQELIQQARVCLNLHQFESRSFESPRLFELLSAGAFVVSEEIEDSFPFRAGVDYASYRTEQEVFDLLDCSLQDEEFRSRIARSGQATARRFPFETVFGELSLEMQRLQRQRRDVSHRLFDWILASLSMAKIDFVDWLAAKKRKVLER